MIDQEEADALARDQLAAELGWNEVEAYGVVEWDDRFQFAYRNLAPEAGETSGVVVVIVRKASEAVEILPAS